MSITIPKLYIYNDNNKTVQAGCGVKAKPTSGRVENFSTFRCGCVKYPSG